MGGDRSNNYTATTGRARKNINEDSCIPDSVKLLSGTTTVDEYRLG